MPTEDEIYECFQIFTEIVLEEGELVARKEWDSGGPGGGAGVVTVYEFRSCFFGVSDEDFRGPFDDLDEACDSVGLKAITSATQTIVIHDETIYQREGS